MMDQTSNVFCQECGTTLLSTGICPRCTPKNPIQEYTSIPSKIFLMPHSTEREPEFKTVEDFLEYLEEDLAYRDPIIYRNSQPRGPGKFIFVFHKLILGECEILNYEKMDREDNYGYKYAYMVKKRTIRIYQRFIRFKEFRDQAQLPFTSPNFGPSISLEQYKTLQQMIDNNDQKEAIV